jgi:hypothetical protein
MTFFSDSTGKTDIFAPIFIDNQMPPVTLFYRPLQFRLMSYKQG